MNTRSTAHNAWIENALARAWKQLYGAAMEADKSGRRSTAEDLYQICDEVRRVQENLLRLGGRLKTREVPRANLYPRLFRDPPASA